MYCFIERANHIQYHIQYHIDRTPAYLEFLFNMLLNAMKYKCYIYIIGQSWYNYFRSSFNWIEV